MFYFFEFIINITKNLFILNLWFIMGFKTCRKQSMQLRQLKTCCNKAWDSVLKPCAQFMSHLFLWYIDVLFTLIILFISIFIILTNVDTLITLYFYVCKWNLKKTKIIDAINKTILQTTQVMEVARALTTVPINNDDLFGFQCNLLYFLK